MTADYPHPATTMSAVDEAHRAHAVTIAVNERPVRMPSHRETGLAIKEAAIAQGVPIQPDFVLTEELSHGHTRVVGDSDHVELREGRQFLANDGDDNS